MCGIAGSYQQPDGAALVDRMAECIAHRGPDDAGVYSYTDERVTTHLGHRRLSIIDVSRGHQPLVKQGLALTYNGELYNFMELRRELEAKGAVFHTASDTEVVLEAWRQWGPGCLAKFRGMFAFSLFDEQTGSLFLARDHLGIKPLHYMRRSSGVVFASELKALVAVFGSELKMDAGALISSINYYWVPDRRCAIMGVEKLQPGTWAEFRPDGASRFDRFWDASEAAAAAARGGPQDLRSVVEDSVRAHLVADVPVSSFLSGGLDSSVVTVLAQRTIPGIDAYTIRFRPEDNRLEAMPDDAVYARKVAQQHGISLHEIEISPDIVGLLPRMVDILDEPTGDPAAINSFLMCHAAREAGVKVILSGMGADELFGGYRKHVACTLAARYQKIPRAGRHAVRKVVSALPVAAGGRGFRSIRWAKRYLTLADLPEEPGFRRSYTLYSPDELVSLVGPDFQRDVVDLVDEHSSMYWDNSLTDPVNRMCLMDARHFLPGLNLAYTDRASMAASTEVRVPFVDPFVFQAAFSLSGAEKVGVRQGKLALKKAATAWLPNEIVYRPKASFSAPLRAWIARDLRSVVDEQLVGGELVSCGFLRRDRVSQLIEEDRSGREDRSKQVWQLLTLELWYRGSRSAGVTL
jgi:asparagine synthase (glutamine-hydrolysing)